jgi:O-antigen ligase
MMRGVFLCLALGAVLNVFFVFNNSEAFVNHLKGYPGYFSGKNALGEFAAIAFLVSLHETLYPLIRRSFGILILVIATVLLFYANSKTSLGLAFIVPCLAGLILVAARLTRISPAILLLFIPFFYIVLSVISGLSMNRVSFWIYGDPTFTGRTLIWDFANSEIARRPLLGWGYQSFWLVGLDGPSVVDAPGWIKNMPNAHNGYVDTKLELGYVGLALLITFILATLHAIGRVADRDRGRAWLLLSLALFVICYSFLESAWMRGYEFLWVMFVIVAAEAGRYWQPLPRASAMYRSVIRKQSSPHPSRVFLKPQ